MLMIWILLAAAIGLGLVVYYAGGAISEAVGSALEWLGSWFT